MAMKDDLEWTRKKPAIPGTYWYQETGGPRLRFNVEAQRNRLFVHFGNVEWPVIDMPGKWKGPMPLSPDQ